ncbi:MAG: sigma factor-like helix-turn-helix DNA-binding protein [Parcubacteria group bacterium]
MSNEHKSKNNKETGRAKASTEGFSFLLLAEKLLADLTPRSREIIRRRFGLVGDQSETLEKIGQRYEITRERVRQIITEAVKNISQRSGHEDFLSAEEKIVFTIIQNGGIIREVDAIEKIELSSDQEANAVKFFVSCSKNIFEVEEKGLLEKAWVVSLDIIEGIKRLIVEAEKNALKDKELLADEEMLGKLAALIPDIPKEQIMNFLSVSERVKKNKFGKWGIIDWMEVSPKGTREKVYLILKEHKKPLHFTEIAGLIDKYELSKRGAHPQTVHNELIKDERFVLVGRGIYALSEWGYFSGTIRDIIEVILKASGRAMKKEEVIAEVLKMRKVKKTTIMINLNNRKFFKKEGEFYKLKK